MLRTDTTANNQPHGAPPRTLHALRQLASSQFLALQPTAQQIKLPQPVAIVHREYPLAANHDAYPDAYGASGPEATGTHNRPPINASNQIEQTEHGKPRPDQDDYVLQLTPLNRVKQGRRGPREASRT